MCLQMHSSWLVQAVAGEAVQGKYAALSQLFRMVLPRLSTSSSNGAELCQLAG
jgi:hypothetical protein